MILEETKLMLTISDYSGTITMIELKYSLFLAQFDTKPSLLMIKIAGVQ